MRNRFLFAKFRFGMNENGKKTLAIEQMEGLGNHILMVLEWPLENSEHADMNQGDLVARSRNGIKGRPLWIMKEL